MSVLNTIRKIGTVSLLVAASGLCASGQAVTPSGNLPGTSSQALQPLQPQPLAMPVKGLPDGYVQLPFRVSVLASGGAAPYQMRFSGNLPDGVTSEVGSSVVAIGGVPTEAGSFDFQVTVTDVNGYTMSHDYTIQVHPEAGRGPGEVPVADAESIKVTDTESIFFPAVIQLSEGMHIIDGMTDFGAKELSLLDTLVVNDVISVFFGAMISDSEPLRLTEVDAVSLKIGLIPATVPPGTYHLPYLASFTAVGYSGNQQLSHTGTLPAGLSFSTLATLVTISGTPTQTGSFPFTISAFDGIGGSGTTTIAYTLVINKATQSITIGAVPSPTYGNAGFSLSATASSGLGVTIAPVSGPVSGSGNGPYTITGAGTATFRATQTGSADYEAAPPVTFSVNIAPALLTATATSVSRMFGQPNPTFAYSLAGFKNGDISAVVSGVATLNTTAISASPVSIYPITFATEGLSSSNYSITYVPGTLTVLIASQTITFDSLANTPPGVGSIVLTATASSGLLVSYTVTGPATISGSTLTIIGAGLITVTPSQAGNSNYAPVTGASRSFTAAGPVAGTIVLITTSSLQRLGDGSYQETVTIVNNGTAAAQNVVITAASLGNATASSGAAIPRALGSIAAGGTAVTSFSFASSAGAPGTGTLQHIVGTYTGGTFGGSFRAVLP